MKCLYFDKGQLKVQNYVAADFKGEVDHKKNMIGYIFIVGCHKYRRLSLYPPQTWLCRDD